MTIYKFETFCNGRMIELCYNKVPRITRLLKDIFEKDDEDLFQDVVIEPNEFNQAIEALSRVSEISLGLKAGVMKISSFKVIEL